MKKEIIIYQSSTGALEVRLDKDRETIMLTQQQVGDLFGVQKAAISKHVKNIFDTNELDKKATVSILETVQVEGKREIKRRVENYNLDLILSIANARRSILKEQTAKKSSDFVQGMGPMMRTTISSIKKHINFCFIL